MKNGRMKEVTLNRDVLNRRKCATLTFMASSSSSSRRHRSQGAEVGVPAPVTQLRTSTSRPTRMGIDPGASHRQQTITSSNSSSSSTCNGSFLRIWRTGSRCHPWEEARRRTARTSRSTSLTSTTSLIYKTTSSSSSQGEQMAQPIAATLVASDGRKVGRASSPTSPN